MKVLRRERSDTLEGLIGYAAEVVNLCRHVIYAKPAAERVGRWLARIDRFCLRGFRRRRESIIRRYGYRGVPAALYALLSELEGHLIDWRAALVRAGDDLASKHKATHPLDCGTLPDINRRLRAFAPCVPKRRLMRRRKASDPNDARRLKKEVLRDWALRKIRSGEVDSIPALREVMKNELGEENVRSERTLRRWVCNELNKQRAENKAAWTVPDGWSPADL